LEAGEQIRKFQEFFELYHHADILENIRKDKYFFAIDFKELSKFDSELSENLLENPKEVIRAAELAIENFELPKSIINFRVRIKNLPDTQKIKIRDIRSKHLGALLCIEGVVRQKTEVRPQVTNANFECPSCGNIINVLQLEPKFKEPSRCGCGRKGKFKLLSKELIDVQKINLEEAPDDLDGGEQPKRMSLFLKEDLVSPLTEKKTNPGSKIKVSGIVNEIPIPSKSGGQSTLFDLMIFANYIEPINEDFYEIKINDEDEKAIQEYFHLCSSQKPVALSTDCRKRNPFPGRSRLAADSIASYTEAAWDSFTTIRITSFSGSSCNFQLLLQQPLYQNY